MSQTAVSLIMLLHLPQRLECCGITTVGGLLRCARRARRRADIGSAGTSVVFPL